MAIIAFFDKTNISQQQYDQVAQELEAQGLEAPDGRLYHVAWNTAQGTSVLEVWESEGKMGKFAESLMPIIAGVGATPPEPQIAPAHNIIKG